MKYSLLSKYRDSLQEVIESFSAILKLDVEITDLNLNVVAGTGKLRKNIDKKAQGNTILEVLKEKKVVVIKDPGIESICEKCIERGDCREELELSAPLYYDGSVVGVLSFICHTKVQKAFILDRVDKTEAFLETLSTLITKQIIALKREEEIRINRDILPLLLSNIEGGLIHIKEKTNVKKLNAMTLNLLNISSVDYSSITIHIQDSENHMLFCENEKLLEMRVDDKTYSVKGVLIPLLPIIDKDEDLFIIKEVVGGSEGGVTLNKTHPVLLGSSKKSKDLVKDIYMASLTRSLLLIEGEVGSKLDEVARSIHNLSTFKEFPFTIIHCGRNQDDVFERAFSKETFGTVFFYEFEKLKTSYQYILLETLENQRDPLKKDDTSKARYIVGSNLTLKELSSYQNLHKDLFYSLNVAPIKVPPLRDRRSDIWNIITEVLSKYSRIYQSYLPNIDEEAKAVLCGYNWPGNLQELENCIEYLITNYKNVDQITASMIPFSSLVEENSFVDEEIITPLETLEKHEILKALNKYGRSMAGKKKVAKSLGIGLATLYRKITKYEL